MKVVDFVKKTFKNLDKRRLIFSLIFSLFLSIFLIIGKQLNETGTINWGFVTPLNIFVACFIIGAITYYFLDKINLKKTKQYNLKYWQIFLPLFLVSFFILFAVYPGNYNYDAMWQYSAYKSGQFTTHYPVFYFMIFGNFLDFINSIFHDYNFAVFLFNLCQIIFINAVVAYVIYFCSKRLKNKWFTIATILFYALNPLYICLIISTCHDVGFAALFALIAIEVIKMVETDDYFQKKSNWFKVIALTFIFCILRNNGLFTILPALILGVFFIKGKRVKFVVIFSIPLLLFQAYNTLLIDKIVIRREPIVQEAMNVPIMQIARALYYKHPTVWSEELHTYFKPECNWASYGKYPMISDRQKRCMRVEYISEHIVDFAGYWAKIGAKTPHSYVEAPLLFWLGAYYPFTTYYEDEEDNLANWSFHSYAVHNENNMQEKYVKGFYDKIDVERRPNIKIVDDAFEKLISKQEWCKIYFFRVLWSASFPTLILLFAIIYNIYKKRYKYLVLLSFAFSVLLNVLLSPTVCYRYIFPLIVIIPILLYTIFIPYEKNERK